MTIINAKNVMISLKIVLNVINRRNALNVTKEKLHSAIINASNAMKDGS